MLFIFISLHCLSTFCNKHKSDLHVQEYKMTENIQKIICLSLNFILISVFIRILIYLSVIMFFCIIYTMRNRFLIIFTIELWSISVLLVIHFYLLQSILLVSYRRLVPTSPFLEVLQWHTSHHLL